MVSFPNFVPRKVAQVKRATVLKPWQVTMHILRPWETQPHSALSECMG